MTPEIPARQRHGPPFLRRRPAPGQATTQTIESVWYRATTLADEYRRSRFIFMHRAYEDRGCLAVSERSAEFIGEHGRVVIADVKNVAYGTFAETLPLGARSGIVNKWVLVRYGVGEVAMLMDGRWRGWAAVFGGMRRILEAVSHLAPQP